MSEFSVPQSLVTTTIPREILAVLSSLSSSGYSAFLVGGLVRDRLLGKESNDYDIATSAHAHEVMKLFRRVIPTGIQHGTVTVHTGKYAVEVTTFRGEGDYVDGRRPESVVFLDNIVDDLSRRDFTINAMAYDPLGQQFIDPFGGIADLERRQVRCVGDPYRRFSEDGLRSLRAIRFASVLGFELEPATRQAIPSTLQTFNKIAKERIREELSKMLQGPHPSMAVELLANLGLLAIILPELTLNGESSAGQQALVRLQETPADLCLRWSALLGDLPCSLVRKALKTLRYPNHTIEKITRLTTFASFAHQSYPQDGAMRKAISRAGRDLVPGLLDLGWAQSVAKQDPQAKQVVEKNRQMARRIMQSSSPLTTAELALNGQEIMAILGVSPGPKVGEAVRYLLDQVLENPEKNSKASLERLLWDQKNKI